MPPTSRSRYDATQSEVSEQIIMQIYAHQGKRSGKVYWTAPHCTTVRLVK